MKKLLLAILAAIVLTTASVLVYFVYPDVSSLKNNHPEKSAFMEYRQRQWAAEGKNRKIFHRWVPLKRISPYLIKAVIIAEDDKFWRHEGFDFKAMEQAFQKDLRERKFKAGGSTISQQLAKNLYLTPSKNPLRKLREAILTWRMEKALTSAASWSSTSTTPSGVTVSSASRPLHGTTTASAPLPSVPRRPPGSRRSCPTRSGSIPPEGRSTSRTVRRGSTGSWWPGAS
jgi:hypothetical protein